jgi:hypothetical protein
MKLLRPLALIVCALVSVLTFSPLAHAAPGDQGIGTLTIVFNTPEGVPGLTELVTNGGVVAGVAAKALTGTTSSTTLSVPAGVYKIEPRPVMAAGLRYIGIPDSNAVNMTAGAKRTITVRYGLSKGLQHLEVTDLAADKVALSWQLPAGSSLEVRRTEGAVAARSPSQGTEVLPTGSTVTDTGLKPGVQYNYSFWVRPGDSAFGVTQSNGPVVFSVGTPDPNDPTKATYGAIPGTRFMDAAQLAEIVPLGDGVRVTLASGVPTPAPGTALILPISDVLRGGYLGVVTSVSADGRIVTLRAGGLGDAFDFYGLDVPDTSKAAVQQLPAAAPTTSKNTQPSPNMIKQQKAKASRAVANGAAKSASPQTAAAGLTSTEKGLDQQVKPECGVDIPTEAIDFKPKFGLSGHFSVYMTKKHVAWWEVPTGVTWDIEQVVTVSGAMKIDVKLLYKCQVTVNPIMATFSGISIYLKPTVEVGVGGLLKVSNVGVALTTGFQTQGHVGFDGSNNISGKKLATATPLTPVYEAGGTAITGKISATVLIGPGAGSADVGVIVGIGGELSPLDMTVTFTLPLTAGASPCFSFEATYTIGAIVSARAWLGPISFEGTYPIPALTGTSPYANSPFHLPTDCDKVATPPESIIGSGVTKVGDNVTGSPDQMGYVDGFAPGTKTWVLSTGKISDAQGVPSYFASSSMGMPGDPTLSDLSGHQTYDAAGYTVTVVPTGHSLKVKYVFASEEYPEYVGTGYNDVMAVFVNGTNCALVPGTTTPVSINTVNAGANSQYYVDNQTGASGYGTTYDGLTTPLVCSAPVTPGVPATVRIVVADASDSIYDSAVALLDQGIWSE